MEHCIEYLHIEEMNYNKVNESHRNGNHPKQIIGPDTGTGKMSNAHVLTGGMGDDTGTTEWQQDEKHKKIKKIKDLTIMTISRMATILLVRIMVYLRRLQMTT